MPPGAEVLDVDPGVLQGRPGESTEQVRAVRAREPGATPEPQRGPQRDRDTGRRDGRHRGELGSAGIDDRDVRRQTRDRDTDPPHAHDERRIPFGVHVSIIARTAGQWPGPAFR